MRGTTRSAPYSRSRTSVSSGIALEFLTRRTPPVTHTYGVASRWRTAPPLTEPARESPILAAIGAGGELDILPDLAEVRAAIVAGDGITLPALPEIGVPVLVER
jgi:hypothetical protein